MGNLGIVTPIRYYSPFFIEIFQITGNNPSYNYQC